MRVTFTEKTPPEERDRQLAALAAATDDAETLQYVTDELAQYERRFGMSTVLFYPRYLRGEMGDEEDVMAWAMTYRLYAGLTENTDLRVAAAK
jgi:hypothetical protein